MRIRMPLLVALSLSLVPMAWAATTVTDGKDAAGSRLDLKSVTAGASGDRVVLTLRTHRKWKTSLLANGGSKRYACVYLWSPGSDTRAQGDFQVCASVKNGKLRPSVYSKAAGSTVATETAVSRAESRGLRYTIPASLLGSGSTYSWLAGSKDGGKASFDIVPNSGPRRAPLP
jgi:hypothetical protein